MLSPVRILSITLGVALTAAFVISTTVVTVQKPKFESDLEDWQTNFNNCTKKTPEISIEDTTQTLSSEKVNNYRLPKDITPSSYILSLYPNLKTLEFTGTVGIEILVVSSTNKIVLHSKGLTIQSIRLQMWDKQFSIKSYIYDDVREFLIINLTEKLTARKRYVLTIKYNGTMKGKIVGLYSSMYQQDGKEKWIATSKFEPTYARQAFPCFDEPEMKAHFSVTLVRPKDQGYIALSNMDQEKEVTEGDLTSVFFKKSVRMSTYLACFIVCDFKYQSLPVDTKGLGEPFNMRVFATPGQVDKVKFALETGVKITEYYIDYFQLEYPLPKLDMIAIPDFVSGAMEHWGLVTFRETALLYDEKTSSTANKERVGNVVAHELAHMWFGNLVTMKWWNDLWLNEGFASYIQYKGVDYAHKNWKLMDRFITDTMHGVMNLDATLASHPIVQSVENPDQITELFDSITYSKGASIIRMLENYVGSEKFRTAVTKYLDKYKFSNAQTDDFLEEVNSVAPDLKVAHLMQTWTYQKGLPVVEVKKNSGTEYILTQKRFLSNPEDEKKEKTESSFGYKWHIPITYRTSKNKDGVQSILFKYNDPQVTITLSEPVEWIKINIDQVGYYRVNYPLENWENITSALLGSADVLSVADRANLLNDAFALANAEHLSYNKALDLTTYLKAENDYVPWSVASSELLFLRNILSHTEVYENFIEYARDLVKGAYTSVGWKVTENHLENLLRVTVLSTSCALELQECVTEVSQKFTEWLKEPKNSPNPDIRSIVYSYGMKFSGNEQNWNQVWTLFKAEEDANEKLKLMSALSMIQVPRILTKFIDLAWDQNNVRGQDYFACLQNIAANPIGEPIVWDYVRNHWDDLVERFGLNERYLGRMIPSITKRFATAVKLQEMEDFFKKYPVAGAGTAARNEALATVKRNIKWLEVNKDKVSSWLSSRAQI